MTQEALSERQHDILCEVVQLYLEKGEPVSSSAVAATSSTQLSSASIRTVMSELERNGLLEQPHTSAGRIPSDSGLSLFVRRLLHRVVLAPQEQRRIRAMLSNGASTDRLLDQTSRVLARVTREVGMALVPAPRHVALRAIHFLRVGPARVVATVVTLGGSLDSRLLSVGREYSTDELERISRYCNESFSGLPLTEIRSRLLQLMVEERTRYDELIAGVVELGKRAMEAEPTADGEIYLQGAERVVQRVERNQLEALRQLFAAVSDKATLLELLNEFLALEDPLVLVGSQLTLGVGNDLGLIVTSFEMASGERGLIGVMGLKRMNYPYIIPVVDFLGQCLGELGQSAE